MTFQGTPVLVTGASTGIGRLVTQRLAAQGCVVYAGARKASDLRALGLIENVRPLSLDVTCAQDITAAAERVAADGVRLYGLVNNAGVVTLGPVVDGDDKEFDLLMQVNVYGPYRMTRAFARQIVASRGRVVTIGSVAGVLAQKDVAAYSMSKHAVEAFTDCLALELETYGACASIVEPGRFRSEIGRNAIHRCGANPLLPDFYEFKEPDEVATAVQLALFEPKPKRRYLVVPDQRDAAATIKKQIEQLTQLNAGHPYSYDRASLIAMLDDALAANDLLSAAQGATHDQ